MLCPHAYCYFIFRVGPGERYDVRLPDGGVVVRAWSDVDAIVKAYREAARHLPCKEGEIVVCHPVRDRRRRHNARLMQEDWERALRNFEELMTC